MLMAGKDALSNVYNGILGDGRLGRAYVGSVGNLG
jgi:hypothetical protein